MTQASNVGVLTPKINSSGQLDATTGLTGSVPVANGGTGAATYASNNVLLGNGTSAFQVVAPGTNGNILTSNGTTWTSAAPASSGNPAGTIVQFAGTSAPTGYLLCPTSATTVSRTTYATLFAAIGTTWGAGDGSTTFGLPWFAANYAAVQANSNVGTATVGEVISHQHQYSVPTGGCSGWTTGYGGITTDQTGLTGGTANLAAGARVLFIIKF